MKVKQYVMAYGVDQDKLRSFLPHSFETLRPVLRINAEIRNPENNDKISHTETKETSYLEFNVPVAANGKRGWLNIDFWDSENDELLYTEKDDSILFSLPFLEISFTPVGLKGGCPAEKDNDGCFFLKNPEFFRPAETINEIKEFCDCKFAWKFSENNAHGESTGKTIPAFFSEQKELYPKQDFSPQVAATFPCMQVLGSYTVTFNR